MNKKSIAIITARGGSKRIPRKNIKPFLGKPIVQYSIEAALQSGCFNEVMVSTDDLEIAELAKGLGAKIPFIRSTENADDYSSTSDVLIEVLNEYKKRELKFKYACCIYPTAPFITSDKLKLSYQKLVENNAKSVFPIVRFGYPILRSLQKKDDFIKLNWPEHILSRSQDLPPSFHDAGQFYFFEVNSFLREKLLLTDQTIGIEIPESEAQDIDNEEDWLLAEIKYTFLQKRKNQQNV